MKFAERIGALLFNGKGLAKNSLIQSDTLSLKKLLLKIIYTEKTVSKVKTSALDIDKISWGDLLLVNGRNSINLTTIGRHFSYQLWQT